MADGAGVPGWAEGAFILAVGMVTLGVGIHLYMRRELPRGWVVFLNALPFYYRGNLYAVVPYGLGFSLGGLAVLAGHSAFTGPLLIGALACCAFGLVAVFWHPNWMRPRSLRGPPGD